MPELREFPHRRYNPLRREWVLVSPQRTRRPWQGALETLPPERLPEYDPECYLCPGNRRAGEAHNPSYTGTFVFDNDFAALLPEAPDAEQSDHPLLRARTEAGICRVVCYSPRHDLALSQLDQATIRQVVDCWVEQHRKLGSRPGMRWVQAFENRGAAMGASNPHPHGQIWASRSLPNEPTAELASQSAYHAEHGRCLLCDYLKVELDRQERVVFQEGAFACVVPFWAVWPFETLLVSTRHLSAFAELEAGEREGLASSLQRLTRLYDKLFQTPFPYSMGFHPCPTDADTATRQAWHFHAHFYPPLLRSATIRKFMVGYELLAEPQRDLTAEAAAERLRMGDGPP